MKTVDFAGVQRAPSKVVCVGRNYLEHIEELENKVPEEMVLFFKPNAAIGRALKAKDNEVLHYEGEICFGVESGRFRYVGFGLDLTKRQLQGSLKSQGLPWERCKAFRGSALFSTFVPFEGAVETLSLELRIDGDLIQEGGVPGMIFKPAEILAEISKLTDLEEHDIVMSGTPKGVGAVAEGALFEGRILQEGRELVRVAWRAIA
ncbi:fumarylacetoacetate hydrolase family protein [Pelagicoccus sp. NFK12]|uniref:Fumarylacetoacetate hydrolase family protein n=1 Tax=Pelagicoccus enzymogenes TaxID=2773457 RepID=A0A927FB64_9BACT|nr:fumarylacetoacetate hydrolase family protein [Pelagicoccus enzymogenes]MBD5780228.1 fumarylacetoacetate hydrolase family protein [Pelagicoccus enzymogenes]